LKAKNVTLSGIVGDNLRAQVAGLAHWMPDSFQNITADENPSEHKAVIYIPCCCHVLNLAFSDVIRNNEYFRKLTTEILAFSVILRKTELVRLFEARIPEVPTTRWIYLYDISKWLTKYSVRYSDIIKTRIFKERIEPILIQKNLSTCIHGIPHSYIELNRILLPVKVAMNQFEDPKTSLSDVYTILDKLFHDLKEMTKEQDLKKYKQQIKFIINTVKERFRTNSRLDLIITANVFTAPGRHMLRKIGSESDNCVTKEFSGDEEEETNKQPAQLISHVIDPEAESDSEDTIYGNNVVIENSDNDFEPSSNLYELNEEEFAIEDTGFIGLDDSESLYSIVLTTIEGICKSLNLNQPAIDKCYSDLDDFLFNPTRTIPRISDLITNPYEFWKMTNFRKKSDLATIALRLLSLGASEACCERYISQNRKTLDEYSSRQKDDLLQARNIIRANYLIKTTKSK
jgi:hypothetical protein